LPSFFFFNLKKKEASGMGLVGETTESSSFDILKISYKNEYPNYSSCERNRCLHFFFLFFFKNTCVSL